MNTIEGKMEDFINESIASGRIKENDPHEFIEKILTEFEEIVMNPKLDENQKDELIKGLKNGIDYKQYNDPDFSAQKMKIMRESLESNLDISLLKDKKLDVAQVEIIKDGLSKGLDVSKYASSDFSAKQMEQIHKGLERGLDVSSFAASNISAVQMENRRKAIESGTHAYGIKPRSNSGFINLDPNERMRKRLKRMQDEKEKKDKERKEWDRVSKKIRKNNEEEKAF